jgi:hypothetical protein
MNSSSAHVFENGIGACRGMSGVFEPTKLGPLPFLLTIEPAHLSPVRPAINSPGAACVRTTPKGWSEFVESFILKLVVGLFMLTLLAAGFGVQQISHVRARNQLGRELRQKEYELRTATLAYRSLESRKAVELAQASASSAMRLASAANPPRDNAPRVVRTSTPAGAKPAQTASVAPRRSPSRNEVVTRNRTRSSGARG